MTIKGKLMKRAALMACAATAPFWVTPAFAQDAPVGGEAAAAETGSGGDIVVTAQRREQSIQNVGVSITALSGDTLADLGATSAQSIAAHVPGLLFDSGSGGGVNAFVSIRGVSQVDPAEHQEAPNAVYLDEVYVPTPSMVGFPLYDISRAEALRGPQGTLFGRNSTGGLLQFITTDPSDSYRGYFDASYGNYDNIRLEGAVGGPIAEGLSFRLAGMINKSDGIFKNHFPGGRDSFETNVFGIRGKLRAELGDWTAQVTGSVNKSPKHREGVYKASPAFVDGNGVPQYLPANVDFYGTGAGNDQFGYRDPFKSVWDANFDSSVGSLRKQFNYVTLKIEGPVGGATLTSVGNYSYGHLDYSEDSDGTPAAVNVFGNGGTTKQLSEELRLSGSSDRLNWTAGVYFLDIRGDYYIDLDFPFLASTTPFHTASVYSQRTRTYAAFAQLEYELTDSLQLTLGGRYTHDRKTFDSQVFDLTAPGSPVIYDFSRSNPAVGDLARMSKGDWTGKIQLEYKPNSDVLLYAGVSRGIRAGGFNASPDGAISYAATPFGGETVIAYEGGAKLRLFGNRANLRASAFYYDYSDYQAFNFIGTAGSVSNNPAYNYGGEVEFTANPLDGLDLSLGAAFLRGKVKDYNTALGTVIDTEPVKAPHFTLNGIISKRFDIGAYQLKLQYDFDYQSKNRANLFPSPITELPSSWMHNARITFGKDEAGWEIYGFVRNIGNTARKSFAYDLSFASIAIASYAPPRTYGLGARLTF